MKVLIVSNMYPKAPEDNRGIFIRDQVEAIKKKGITVDVWSLDTDRNKLYYITGLFRLLILTLHHSYDIIHAHYGLTGAICCLRYRTPLVTTFHGSDVNILWQRRFSRIAARFSARTIFVSEAISGLLPHRNGRVIPCGVDFNRFKPCSRAEARRELGLPAEGKTVLFPGSRDNHIKNYPLFKQVIEKLADRHIGTLELTGYPHDRVPMVLNACDAVLMTSLHEGSPVIVKEALACNIPVVSVDVGDVREVLNGVPDCRVCGRDPDELAAVLNQALTAPPADRRSPIKHLDNDVIADQIIQVYRECLPGGQERHV